MNWAGDFNRHHPLWDRGEDTHLFTAQAQRAAERLINMLAKHDMEMALPKGNPTLQHMSSKRFSCPDNLFCSASIRDCITRCEVVPSLCPPCTDHFPIVTHLTLPQSRIADAPNYNFRDTDWDAFRKALANNLPACPTAIETEEQLTAACDKLTHALQKTIGSCVKHSKPRPDSKRWWNSDLTKMRRRLNKLRVISYRFRAMTNHPSHRETKMLSNKYGEEILSAKRQHWVSYLEDMLASDIWTANKYLRDPVGDGGTPRIPTL